MQEPKKHLATQNYYIVCHKKEAFRSWDQAERVRKRMGRSGKGCRVQVYHCPFCKQFHIGANGRKEKYNAKK